MKGARLLVTGAGGFLGSHLAERLAAEGEPVRVFVRYNSRNDWGLLEILPESTKACLEVVTGDIKDPHAVERAVRGTDVVIHLAALVSIPYSYRSPLDFIQTNITGTSHLLQAAVNQGVKKFIHTSTSEVYGTARRTPIDEDHPLRGQSPYSASKIGADMLAESYRRSFGLPVVVIRPFNTYGPRQSARAIIPSIIAQALAGDRIRVGSLAPRRDFNFVTDTVDAFVRAIRAPDIVGETINVGSGSEVSVEEVVAMVGTILAKSLRVEVEPGRIRPGESEVERLVADARRARALLGWEPKVPFAEGLAATADWIGRNLHRFKTELYNS